MPKYPSDEEVFRNLTLDREWIPDEVKRVLINPIYTGIRQLGIPAIVPDELWIKANVKMIKEIGAEAWLRMLLDVMHNDYMPPDDVR